MAFDQRWPQVSLDGIIIGVGSVEADVIVGIETSGLVVEHVWR